MKDCNKVLLFGIGVFVGILIAPDSGKQTIKNAKTCVNKAKENVTSKVSELRSDSGIDEIEDSFYSKASNFKNNFVELKREILENVDDAIENSHNDEA